MEEFILTRSGEAPLKFTGEVVAESDGRHTSGRENNRWHNLTVYRTAGGRYVAAVEYRTCWQGESERSVARVVGSAAEAAAFLTGYDPAGDVDGYPPGPAYEDKQRRLLADVGRRYAAQVSQVLAGDEFAEAIE